MRYTSENTAARSAAQLTKCHLAPLLRQDDDVCIGQIREIEKWRQSELKSRRSERVSISPDRTQGEGSDGRALTRRRKGERSEERRQHGRPPRTAPVRLLGPPLGGDPSWRERSGNGDRSELADSAAAGGADKPRYVRQIFSQIAPRYDLLNHVLRSERRSRMASAGASRACLDRAPDGLYVDLCAGTLDVAALLARQQGFRGRVLGADFALPMLRAGAHKAPRSTVLPVAADALDLPVGDGVAHGVIVAFGLRNVADLDRALVEVRRVLAPSARLVILEFSTPHTLVVRTLYQAYFHHVVPAIGGAVSGQPTAYRYLPRSVDHFPDAPEMARRMEGAGFRRVRWHPLTLGIATVHVGERR